MYVAINFHFVMFVKVDNVIIVGKLTDKDRKTNAFAKFVLWFNL